MHSFVRKLIFAVLPARAIGGLRKWHAPRVARSFSDQDWEPAAVVKALLRPGDLAVDVGANMGYITARLADYVGANGRVVAIEPVPETFAMLAHTVRTLALHQVRPVNACASREGGGHVTMSIPVYVSGGENLYEARIVTEQEAEPAPHTRAVYVPSVAVDQLIDQKNERVRFMKIDVEGHENEVVDGAGNLLKTHGPALLIEVNGDPDDPSGRAHALVTRLAAAGYAAYSWDGTNLHPRHSGDQRVDYFFFRPEHMETLSCFLHPEGVSHNEQRTTKQTNN